MSEARTAGTCARCRCSLEVGDLRCPVCALPVPAVDAGESVDAVRSLRCEDCGAPMHFDAARQRALCPFCGGQIKPAPRADPVERAEQYVPFAVDLAAARVGVRRWLSRRRWLAPGDLASRAALEKVQAVHWAAWVVDGASSLSWTAESNQGGRKSPWAPHAGQCDHAIEGLLVSGSRGLRPDEVAALGTYDLGAATTSSPAGSVLEDYGVPRSAARAQILAGVQAAAEERVRVTEVPGSRSRRLHVEVLLRSLRSRRVLLPAWVLAYRYRARVYRAVLHGQDATRVVGQVPVSPWRVLALVAGSLLVAAALVLLRVYVFADR